VQIPTDLTLVKVSEKEYRKVIPDGAYLQKNPNFEGTTQDCKPCPFS